MQPDWARNVKDGLTVASVRARTAVASAIAPFDVAMLGEDGTPVPLTVVRCDVSPKRFLLIVQPPEGVPCTTGQKS